ncbi:ribosome biogenesis GTPase Der [Candidatus Saccharibacteria bacterium]|nr:ribosome biogenesis GTPase Der [Candidatus Saccharibacteria bacterium]
MSKPASIVAIVGRANVGKSSLFNAVIGRREAIVAREAGTTRDSITARASYGGKDFWLVDTAGMKSAEDKFELSIQEQITEAASSANLIVVVVEADVPITEDDRRIATLALKSQKPVILVVNKIDKNQKADLGNWQKLGIKPIIATSTTQKRGLTELLEAISTNLPKARIKQDRNRIRLALLGRPNVGKSSLFNALGAKQQAIVSERAGTTRDVNRLVVRYHEREIELMDTAGIRRSGKIERGVEQFSVLRALAAIEESDIGLLLMDAGELNVQLDQKIAGQVKEAGKGLVLVVCKWDSIDKDAFTRDQLAPQIAHEFAFVPWAPLIFTSAVSGQNVSKIFDLVLEITANRSEKFKTTELNNWLQGALNQHPPAALKGRQPKLNYIVQELEYYDYPRGSHFDAAQGAGEQRTETYRRYDEGAAEPATQRSAKSSRRISGSAGKQARAMRASEPSFKIFGAHTRFLHWSYIRYLERSFREKWPLAGTPLKFWFIEKH